MDKALAKKARELLKGRQFVSGLPDERKVEKEHGFLKQRFNLITIEARTDGKIIFNSTFKLLHHEGKNGFNLRYSPLIMVTVVLNQDGSLFVKPIIQFVQERQSGQSRNPKWYFEKTSLNALLHIALSVFTERLQPTLVQREE